MLSVRTYIRSFPLYEVSRYTKFPAIRSFPLYEVSRYTKFPAIRSFPLYEVPLTMHFTSKIIRTAEYQGWKFNLNIWGISNSFGLYGPHRSPIFGCLIEYHLEVGKSKIIGASVSPLLVGGLSLVFYFLGNMILKRK